MPSKFGSWKTHHNWFNRWLKKGHLDAILVALKKGGDHAIHSIDGTIVEPISMQQEQKQGRKVKRWVEAEVVFQQKFMPVLMDMVDHLKY